MRDLLEHILNENYVGAQDSFHSRMSEIMERKLCENKRMMQSEAFGMLKFTKDEIEAKKKAGFRKASDVLGDPSKAKMKPLVKLKKKKVSEEALDEAGLAATTWRAKLYRVGLKAIRDVEKEKASGADSAEEKQAADLRKSHGVERPEDKKRPGRLQRNINTMMGRKPGYVKPETSDDEKGGRVGKVVRRFGKATGAALSNLGSQYGAE